MTMRLFSAAMAWLIVTTVPIVPVDAQSSTTKSPLLRAPDHVLVWSQQPSVAVETFAALGFQVRPGQTYPEGMTASTIMFTDWSYLELLHFSDPSRAASSAQATAELEFVRQAPGANSFSVQVSDIDAAATLLRRRGFSVSDVVPDMVDPDGPQGPLPPKPASWRDFHFAKSPVSGVELFFIEYPPDEPASPDADERFRKRATHPNGARSLSAVWLLVPDLEAEAKVYARMGFTVGPAITVEVLNARARVAKLGDGAVVIAQSAQLPGSFALPGRQGPRVIGLSFAVDTIDAARDATRVPDGGSGTAAARRHRGPFGDAWLVPANESIGLFLEFHRSEVR